MAFPYALKGLRMYLQGSAAQWNLLNGVTGFATLRANESSMRKSRASDQVMKEQMSAEGLAIAATTTTLVGAGGLAMTTIELEGEDAFRSYYEAVTSFLSNHRVIPDTLAGDIAIIAGLIFVAGVVTAGLIDFASRIHVATECRFFEHKGRDAIVEKIVSTITSCTLLPSIFLLVSHALLFLASLINAVVRTVTPRLESADAWTEVSENSRALSFQLVALVLIPVGNIIDLIGTAVVPSVEGLVSSMRGAFFCCSGGAEGENSNDYGVKKAESLRS